MKCIYALQHTASRKVYIGSTVDLLKRKKLWSKNFERGHLSKAIAACSRVFSEWVFVVLEPLSDVSPAEIEVIEKRYIERALAMAPDRVLNASVLTTRPGNAVWRRNGVLRSTYYSRKAKGMSEEDALSKKDNRSGRCALPILGPANEYIKQADAARLLGCEMETLANRLKRIRKANPGLGAVKLEDLQRRSTEARKQWGNITY